MGILSDGRITATVDVTGSATVTMNLVVDTGAEASALPYAHLPASAKSAPASRFVTFSIAGSRVRTAKLSGVAAETDVETHSRGGRTRAKSNDIRVHFLPLGSSLFPAGVDGILGMDMLDAFAADPVKDAAAAIAYLARRV